jgi:hypothetical protein
MGRCGESLRSDPNATKRAADLALKKIVGFHVDEYGDWVADLECGHGQHVRHRPPWEDRPWVITQEGRAGHLGRQLDCKKCEQTGAPKTGEPTA